MRTYLQVILVGLVVAFSPVSVAAALVDIMAVDITWEQPQISPDPLVLNGHITWDTVAQHQVSSSLAWTVTGQGAYGQTWWESIWGGYVNNADRYLVLEGKVTGPDLSGSGVPDHGYAYVDVGIPDGVGSVPPGLYGVGPGASSGASALMNWSTRDLGQLPWNSPVSGAVRVRVPLPPLLHPHEVIQGALHRLSPPLQYVTAVGAAALLRAVAIPVRLRSGLGDYGEYMVYLDLRGVTVQVMEGCNGLGFILTLGLGAVLLAAQMRRGAWLLLAVIPLALGANALRVAILSLGVQAWGVDFVRGPTLAHELIGWHTWGAALVALIGLAMLLARHRRTDHRASHFAFS